MSNALAWAIEVRPRDRSYWMLLRRYRTEVDARRALGMIRRKKRHEYRLLYAGMVIA